VRIGVISDTHVPSQCHEMPDAVWRALEGCEKVIHAGDFDSWKTYEDFKRRFPTFGVIGNRDDFGPCEEVPERRILELPGLKVGVIHGWGSPAGLAERIRRSWTEPVDLLIFGHSHLAGLQEVNGVRMLNPGSATDVFFAERQTLAIIELDEQPRIEMIEIGS
jgi:putative phosphoesterase